MCWNSDGPGNFQKPALQHWPRVSSCRSSVWPCDKEAPLLHLPPPAPRSNSASFWSGCPAEPAGTAGSHPRWEPCFPTACQHCRESGSISWRESRAAAAGPRRVVSPFILAVSVHLYTAENSGSRLVRSAC